MNRPLAIVLVLGLLCLSGCEKFDSGRPAARFPGFTQLAAEGEGARLFLHADSARRNRDAWVNFAMIRLLPGTYVLQTASTNCLYAFKAAEGLKFRDDGTLAGRYPGDPEPRSLSADSATGVLVNLACRTAEARRTMEGEFDAVKALDMLYGPFRPELQAAVWENMDPPASLGGAAETLAGKTGLVRLLVSRGYNENGRTKHILITSAKPMDKSMDCRSCAPLIGAAVFVKERQGWRLEREYPYLGQLGLNGEPPEVSWQRIGRDRYALVAKLRDRSQGLGSVFLGAYELGDDAWKPILQFSEQDVERAVPVDLDLRFGEPVKEYADATIEVTSRSGPGVPDRKQIYRYRDGRYVSLDEFFRPGGAAARQRVQAKPQASGPDPRAVAAAWRRKKEDLARRALMDYADAVSGRNLPLALTYWLLPSEKVIRTIQNTEYLNIRIDNVVQQDVDRVSVSVEMEGKPKFENPKVWRGAIDMELEDTGEWRIVSMARLKCVAGCEGTDRRSLRPGDDSAAIKSVVRDYFEALDRRDPDAARLLRHGVPFGFDKEVREKEFAKLTRLDAPIVESGQASVWVNVTVKDFGKSTETLQGKLLLGRQPSGGWVITNLAALNKR